MQDYVIGTFDVADRLESHFTINDEDDPIYFEEAEKDPIWRKAMAAEIEAIESNGTWYLTDLLEGAKRIGVKWISKTKHDEKGNINKHKARWVVCGYSQEYGVDYI